MAEATKYNGINESDFNNGPTNGGSKRRRIYSTKQLWLGRLSSVAFFAVGLVGGLLIGIFVYHGGHNAEHKDVGTPEAISQPISWPEPENSKDAYVCPNPSPVKDSNYEKSIYAPMTFKEMDKTARFLFDKGIISTLKTPENITENFILYQFINPPNKQEALRFLDKGGKHPGRYGKVTVQRGGMAIPDVMEYKVGPLQSTKMTAMALTQPGSINFNSRPYELVEIGIMTEMLKPAFSILEPLMMESFDGATFEDMFLNVYNGPPSTSGETRDVRWNVGFKGFREERDYDYCHLLPLSGSVHNPGTNTSEWYTFDFHYMNQGPYKTASDLMADYNSGKIRKVALNKGYRNTLWDRVFPTRDQSKPLRDKADVPGPNTFNPSGPRYEIRGTNVKWMGWNFDISGGQLRGPALFNIQFKNERIAYELAVNDIGLNYGAGSHAQNNIIYADATYGLMGGDFPTNIMPGVDCPEHGTVLNTTFWRNADQMPHDMRSICIFEEDGQEALWRHVGTSFEAGMRNRFLVVRVPVVVVNYDYTFEFTFFLDGKIFTKAKSSGYIQATFWDEGSPYTTDDKTRDPFGYKISEFQSGPIHDHMFGFKVDMDIVDAKNTFQVIKWKSGPVIDALKSKKPDITKVPSYFIYNETRYIEWEKIERERGISHTEDQQFWLVVNENQKNKWGVERGYQIAPLATGSQSLKTHPLLNALSFTKYHCAVTKRKEEEPTLTSIYDVNRMDNAREHLDHQINDENILNKDIVNWVSVGFLHVPTSEDMPMTVRLETGFMLKPFNFFDYTATFDMPQHTEMRDEAFREHDPTAESCVAPKNEYCRFC